MTIKSHEAWEQAREMKIAAYLETDLDIFHFINKANESELPSTCITVGENSSLGRTLALANLETLAVSKTVVPIDLMVVEYSNVRLLAASYCGYARYRWRQASMAMNSQWFVGWNIGRRAHPNDGRLDLVQWNLSMRELRQVQERLPTGSFMPHPQIKETRASQVAFDLPRFAKFMCDGSLIKARGHVSVSVLPDHLTIAIS